jgi:hypothetical protein
MFKPILLIVFYYYCTGVCYFQFFYLHYAYGPSVIITFLQFSISSFVNAKHPDSYEDISMAVALYNFGICYSFKVQDVAMKFPE